MLVALFLSTILLFLVWWLVHTLIIEFRIRNDRETLPNNPNSQSSQKKPIRTRKTMKSVNRDSDLIFNSQNSPLNRRKGGSSNEPGQFQKKSQRQNEEEQNKLELRISSNCSDTGDQQKQQDLEDYIPSSSNQRYSSQKNISRQESNEEPSYTHSSRIFANPSQYLNGMTTVFQVSEEYRGTERDQTLGQSEHNMTNINFERSEHQSEPNHELAGASFTGIQSSGFNQMKYNRAKTEKDNDSKIPESLMSLQKQKPSQQNHPNSQFQMKEEQKKQNFSEIKIQNFASSGPQHKIYPNSQLQVSEEEFQEKSKDNQQDQQEQEKQNNAEKKEGVDSKQADSKEEADKSIHLNKQNCPPQQSQQLKITEEEQQMRSENPPSPAPSSQKIKLESNMDSFYDLTLSKDDIRQQSKASKPQSDVPLILVHETFNEIMKEKPFVYKYDKNNLPETIPNQQRFIPNSNMSLKEMSKHSLSQKSEAVYKKDLTKLLEQIDSFFMNNSSAEKSNEKNLQSNQYQLATQNYDYSSGAYYYSGQKSQSDIVKQPFHPKDFKKIEQVDTQKHYGTESIEKDSRGEQSLNISSKKENSVSLEVESRKQTIRTNKNLSRPPAPPMRKSKKKKKVSKTEKFKLKHDGEEDEVEESDYPYDQDDDLDNNSLISYNIIQEGIITQLEAKIKKLMNTVSLVQNKHDGLVKQLYHDKEVRDNLVKKCQQLEEEKKIRQKLLNEGLNSNLLNDDQLEPFASYIRQRDRYKQQNERLKQQNEQLKKSEEQDKQQKYMLSEKCRDLQQQQQEEKNNFQMVIQGYEEKIKTQGQLIEESLKKIRQLEGLNGSDEQIDEYQYYVDSHDSFQGFQDKSIQGRSSQRRKKLSMRKSDLQKLKIDSSKKSTPTSSFRVKQNRLLEIAQQVSDLQSSYNKAKQEANNYKQQLEASHKEQEQLKQTLKEKEDEYLSKLKQMEEQLEKINEKANQYLQKYESMVGKYEELKQQIKNKQNQGRIPNDRKNTDLISTASHENTTENQQILKLYHEFKQNNENITAELQFCQQQIQLMFQNQKQLRQENHQLTAQLNNYKNKTADQHAKPIKHNRLSSGQTHQIKNSREHYEEVKKKYLEMKKEREKNKKNTEAVNYHYPRIVSSPISANDIRSHSQENNEQKINPINSWRRSHAFVQHKQQPLHRQHQSYYTSPKSQKNISISSRKSDLHKQKQVYRPETNSHLFKLNSDFLTNPNHPYIQFMNTVLLNHGIKVKNSYKIFSSIQQEKINKTSLKLAISNIENILLLCKIKDENNRNKIIGGFSKLALISDSHHRYISRRKHNLEHQKQAFGILFDYSNFLFYSSRKQHHSHAAVASFDKNILVWGYNELFLDTDQPNILYANFNEPYEAANNIYWGSKEQVSTFVHCISTKSESEDRRTNVKWVPIEGFEIFALSA